MTLVSIVVLSHNYGEFVGQAVESALAQTHPAVEVIAVDDGSTDSSPDVLRSFGPRIRLVCKPNGGNSSAVNVAVPLTRGEIVMFLDADDLLYPAAAAEVVRAWQPGCAKVQFRLSLIDARGRRRGVDPPLGVPMPNGDVLTDLLVHGEYVTPVLSGNAYARTVLERLLPIPEADFRNTDDGYLNPMCAFYGDVVSLDSELGAYRLHQRNLWALSGAVTVSRLRERVEHDLARERYLQDAARDAGLLVEEPLCTRRVNHLLPRLLSLRIEPAAHPVPTDTVTGILRSSLAVQTGGRRPVGLLAALVAIAVLPRRLAWFVGRSLLSSRPKPAWVRAAAKAGRAGAARRAAWHRSRATR